MTKIVELLSQSREYLEADRLIEEARARRHEIDRMPVRQLCRKIDAALNLTRSEGIER